VNLQKRALLLSLFLIFAFSGSVLVFWEEIRSLYTILSAMDLDTVATKIRSWGLWAPVLSVALMVVQAIIAPIPSILVSAANGVVFGPLFGILLSWIGGVVGAVLAFYLGRGMAVGTVHRLVDNSDYERYVKKLSGRNGFRLVLIARLLPFVSFDAVSFAAGVTYMTFRRFFVATGLGMIPGTCAYVLTGHFLGSVAGYTPYIVAGSVGIVVVMVSVWLIRAAIRGRREVDAEREEQQVHG
jgi:uncharacterized membrane protein YdjX (TVP38/TMEM64 family)